MEGNNFPSYHRHLLTLKTAFREVGWGGKNPILLHLHMQCNTRKITDTSLNLLDKPIREIFISYFYTILGWSVEGVRRGSPWTGP